MKELLNELEEQIKNLSFEEMKNLLNKYQDSDVRGIILDAMEEKDFEKFVEFIG